MKLIYREEEREMNPLCIDQCIGLILWSPIDRGFLTGNRSKVDFDKEEISPRKRSQLDSLIRQRYNADKHFQIVERLKKNSRRKTS